MRAVIQRVKCASVKVDGEIISSIDEGLLVLLGVENGDDRKDIDYMVTKIPQLRIFKDENEKMNLSVDDIDGGIIVVSQFTLAGDARHGRRPSFSNAMLPDLAEKMYLEIVDQIKALGIETKTGVFGAMMDVSLTNDGPVTILLDSRKSF